MITRQRLGQLIKEEKFIYTTRLGGKKPEKFKLYKDFYMSQEDTLCCLNKSQEFLVCKVKFKHIFETKDEAEWQLEFGNIQRTETLSLPSWEEFIKICENNDYGYNEITIFDDVRFGYKSKPNGDDGTIYINKGIKTLFMTRMVIKENYLEACEICRKLFLGEEV